MTGLTKPKRPSVALWLVAWWIGSAKLYFLKISLACSPCLKYCSFRPTLFALYSSTQWTLWIIKKMNPYVFLCINNINSKKDIYPCSLFPVSHYINMWQNISSGVYSSLCQGSVLTSREENEFKKSSGFALIGESAKLCVPERLRKVSPMEHCVPSHTSNYGEISQSWELESHTVMNLSQQLCFGCVMVASWEAWWNTPPTWDILVTVHWSKTMGTDHLEKKRN